ncbi:MAG: hypothetical protein V4591_12015 [Bdellovibrionota bacterium]
MNTVLILVCIGVALFIFQCVFFITCIKWLASSKKKRDREFALLDKERAKLIELQSQLKEDISVAKKLADETLKKLNLIGAEAHAEWEDMTKKINEVLIEVDSHSEKLLENNISKLNLQRMSLEKSSQTAAQINEALHIATLRGQKLLKLFDSGIPTEEILKELQINKYADAKKMLVEGVDASFVSKKLGLSMGEVVTLSSFL